MRRVDKWRRYDHPQFVGTGKSGDGLFATHFAFTRDGNQVEGKWIAMRVDDLVANLIYTDPEAFDIEFVHEAVEAMVEKMESVELP